MKNTHIRNLGQVVPAEIRLEVYKQALEIIQKQKDVFNLGKSYGLCILFPCCLWDLDDFLDNAPDSNGWSFYKTIKSFPELTDEMIKRITSKETEEKADKCRVRLLKKFIVQLES